MIALAPAARGLLSVLTFGITVPIGVILAVGLWIHFDKSSSIRDAVDRAVTELVAGAELEAERSKVEAKDAIIKALKERASNLEAANTRFSESLQEAQADLENTNDQLQEMLSRPVNSSCSVDDDILGRLRNK